MATTKRKGLKTNRPAGTGDHTRTRRTLRTYPRATAFAVGAAFAPWMLGSAFADPAANQLPTGGQVGAGSVSISTTGTKMQIDQTSDKAIINWQNFSIGSNAWVNFNQPSASSVVLNRSVLGAQIFGRLSANGQVFITSGAGVYFARTAQVDVGSLFASSLSIRDQDFMAGRYIFNRDGSAGEVVNEGNIVAVGGYAALAGPQVRNTGVIVAQAGTVALAAGDRVSLDMVGDGLVRVSVDAAALNALALNSGTLQADGGRVVLTARSANALLDTVINNTGVIRATTLVERKGEIVLDGGDKGVVANSGTITATGLEAGQKGGTITIVGDKVGLFDGTRIDASGDAGGGNVIVGGNFHGAGPEQNASQVFVGSDANIKADAITSGNGGNVAVWSDDRTQFYGTISARGGAQSGDGGFVEVSGKEKLVYRGQVDVRAPNGQTGTLLLDPGEVTVIHSTGADTNVDVAGTNPFVDTATGGLATITDNTINSQLATANVIVQAAGNGGGDGSIEFDASSGTVAFTSGGTPRELIFSATGNIRFVGGAGTNTTANLAGGVFSLQSGGTITQQAGGNDALGMLGGTQLQMTAAGGIGSLATPFQTTGVTNLAASTTTGDIYISNSGSDVNVTSVATTETGFAQNIQGISTGSGDISLANDQNITVNDAVSTGAGSITLDAGFSLTINDAVDAGGGNINLLFGQAGNGVNTLDLTNATALTGALITVTGGSAGGTDVILGPNSTNTWTISGQNAGTLNSAGVTSTTMTFTGVEALTGGSGVDTFTLDAGVTSFSGAIDGGTGTNTLAATDGTNAWTISAANTGTLNTDTTFSNIQAITGGSGQDTITGPNATTAWNITGQNAVTVGGIAATSIEALVGNAGDDTFTLATTVTTFNGSIDGGAGTNTLAATDGTNAWAISGQNAGTLNTSTTFTNMQALTGGSDDDTFTLASGVTTFAGSISGGAGGTDTLVATDGTNAWAIASANTGTLNTSTSFSNIDVITGGSGQDTITGPNATTAWNITGQNAVTVGGIAATNIEALVGNAGDDTFTLASTVTTFNGSIDGGAGTNTLAATDGTNAWAISGQNAGTLNTSTTFTNMQALTGGSDNDTFTLNAGVTSFSGAIDGGTGTNTLAATDGTNAWTVASANTGTLNTDTTFSNIQLISGGSGQDTITGPNAATAWSITGQNAVTVLGIGATSIDAVVGGTNNDTFTFASGVTTFGGTIDGGTGTDTIAATDGTNAWTVTSPNNGTLNGQAFSNIEALNGGTGADTFTLNAGVTSFAGAIDGGTGTNTLAATDGTNAWTVASANTGTLNTDTTFSNIQLITGGSGDDTVTGPNAATAWSITGQNAVTVLGINATGIEHLVGNANSDTFTFASAVTTFNGSLDGGAGTDTLAMTDGNNTWTITSANNGTVGGQAFSNMEALTGGSGNDSFTLNAGVTTFNGAIDGGGGTNTLAATDGTNAWTVSAANTGTLNTSTTFSNIHSLTGGSAADTLTSTIAGTVAWTITGQNSGTVASLSFSNMESLVGGAGNDTFTLATGVTTFAGSIAGGAGTTDTLAATDGTNAWVISAANTGTYSRPAHAGAQNVERC